MAEPDAARATALAPAPDPKLLAQCREILRRAPAGLLSDVDGTISAIAPTPGDAFVAEAIQESLRRLARRLALVAVVTGRAAEAGRTMVGVEELLYVGNHGMERLRGGVRTAHPAAAASEGALGAALAEIGVALAASPLAAVALVEHKGLTGTVHYRLAPDHEAALAIVGPLVSAAADKHGLRVTTGRAILELRPPVRIDKGTAVAELLVEHGLRGAVFLGDDITDIDAFVAVQAARADGDVETLAIGVVGPETPQAVLTAVDATVVGVEGTAALLAALADDLDGAAAPGAAAPGAERGDPG